MGGAASAVKRLTHSLRNKTSRARESAAVHPEGQRPKPDVPTELHNFPSGNNALGPSQGEAKKSRERFEDVVGLGESPGEPLEETPRTSRTQHDVPIVPGPTEQEDRSISSSRQPSQHIQAVTPDKHPAPPHPWVLVPYEDDAYYWNTETDEVTWDFPVFAPGDAEGDVLQDTQVPQVPVLGLSESEGEDEADLMDVLTACREAKAWSMPEMAQMAQHGMPHDPACSPASAEHPEPEEISPHALAATCASSGTSIRMEQPPTSTPISKETAGEPEAEQRLHEGPQEKPVDGKWIAELEDEEINRLPCERLESVPNEPVDTSASLAPGSSTVMKAEGQSSGTPVSPPSPPSPSSPASLPSRTSQTSRTSPIFARRPDDSEDSEDSEDAEDAEDTDVGHGKYLPKVSHVDVRSAETSPVSALVLPAGGSVPTRHVSRASQFYDLVKLRCHSVSPDGAEGACSFFDTYRVLRQRGQSQAVQLSSMALPGWDQEAPVEASPSSDEGFAEAFAEGIPQGKRELHSQDRLSLLAADAAVPKRQPPSGSRPSTTPAPLDCKKDATSAKRKYPKRAAPKSLKSVLRAAPKRRDQRFASPARATADAALVAAYTGVACGSTRPLHQRPKWQ